MSVNWPQPLRPFVQQLGTIIDALDTDLQGYVNSWLEAHPEATTTVEDDSLTTAKYKDESVTLAKLNDDVLEYIATHGVDTHGYYPYMLVGGADALTSGAVDEAMWQRREIETPNGIAKVLAVKGNTVVWNQMVGSDTSSVTVTSGHKYLAVISGSAAIATSDGTAVSVTGGTDQLFDLTQMFGADNEPTSVAEFEAMFPESYYAYSAPTLKPVSMTGIATTDADGNALDERSIPVSTYFPTGMKKAGSVRDELTAGASVTRVGVVDLGTLTWTRETSGTYPFFRAKMPSDYAAPTTSGIDNLECAKYDAQSSTTKSWMGSNERDGQIRPIYGQSYNVAIQDSSYTDTATFTTALDGVYLFYALATPTMTPIDPPLSFTYRTAEGGTESIVVPDNTISAPPEMSVVYPKIINGDALTAQLIRPNLGSDIIDVPVTLEPAIIGDVEIEPETEEVQTDDIEEG